MFTLFERLGLADPVGEGSVAASAGGTEGLASRYFVKTTSADEWSGRGRLFLTKVSIC
jgi:hypothetical protein